jgi:hypothetical protein
MPNIDVLPISACIPSAPLPTTPTAATSCTYADGGQHALLVGCAPNKRLDDESLRPQLKIGKAMQKRWLVLFTIVFYFVCIKNGINSLLY